MRQDVCGMGKITVVRRGVDLQDDSRGPSFTASGEDLQLHRPVRRDRACCTDAFSGRRVVQKLAGLETRRTTRQRRPKSRTDGHHNSSYLEVHSGAATDPVWHTFPREAPPSIRHLSGGRVVFAAGSSGASHTGSVGVVWARVRSHLAHAPCGQRRSRLVCSHPSSLEACDLLCPFYPSYPSYPLYPLYPLYPFYPLLHPCTLAPSFPRSLFVPFTPSVPSVPSLPSVPYV